jgi:hypothetical protein
VRELFSDQSIPKSHEIRQAILLATTLPTKYHVTSRHSSHHRHPHKHHNQLLHPTLTTPTYTTNTAMTSQSADTRRVQMQRRDSSPRNSLKRRPRLLRAAVTEPSITTSSVGRNALASSQSSRRATDLLNRVVVISGSSGDHIVRPASPMFTRPNPYDTRTRQMDMSSSPDSSPGSFEDFQACKLPWLQHDAYIMY